MPPTKTAPPRYCANCGTLLERKRFASGRLEDFGVFLRRKFCDSTCMALDFDSRPVKPDPSWETAHHHSRKMLPSGPCESCGKPEALDVHHVNGNWRDNSLENLKRLCRSCHNLAHHRRGSCVVCGKPQKGHGYCNKHYLRWKKWGDPLLVKPNQHMELRSAD